MAKRGYKRFKNFRGYIAHKGTTEGPRVATANGTQGMTNEEREALLKRKMIELLPY